MSSTNFRSILIFASCVVGSCNYYVGEFFLMGGVSFFCSNIYVHIYILFLSTIMVLVFYKNSSKTSAVSSTNFGSILIFASCVVGTCNILCDVCTCEPRR